MAASIDNNSAGQARSSAAGWLKTFAQSRAIWPLLALALILIMAGLISPNFFEIRIVQGRLFGNLIDILYRAVPTALVALGMAVVLNFVFASWPAIRAARMDPIVALRHE